MPRYDAPGPAWVLATLLALALGGCSGDDPGFGRWHEVRPTQAAALDSEQQAMIEQLEAIGYLDGSRAPSENRTISVYDESRLAPGLNFYTSGHEPSAILMDMRGNPLHRWHKTFFEIWPDV